MEDLKLDNLSSMLGNVYSLIIDYGLKLIIAIVILIIGLWLIKKLMRTINNRISSKHLDENLRPFIIGICGYALKIMLVITVMSIIGIEMTSFIAVLGAVGLAVGMALSGTLQNFAGGVMILVLKPFQKGDYIEAQGYAGSVEEIQIFNTKIKTPDNKTIIIPNGGLSTSSLINYNVEPTRRVDFSFGIGYSDNIDHAKEVILKVIKNNDKIFSDPEPFIAVGQLADNSVNITTRVWAKTEDYWSIHFYMNETIKKEFDNNNISIPFPQRDVHIYNKN